MKSYVEYDQLEKRPMLSILEYAQSLYVEVPK